jgi:hypothetical protein
LQMKEKDCIIFAIRKTNSRREPLGTMLHVFCGS